ncbi:Erythromycin esterase [Streptococcus varani]|uniref:Erythromycin esterase n=1 Tax=Streptococcus varani TaxID=1608583 RepID=A0A0E3WF33_9STRE|nr:erythromycin esterase family protein [Streptococcus varani]CQR24782.1 Erythromycin esterase [Streptococcus varani]
MKVLKKIVKWFLVLIVGAISILVISDAVWVYGTPALAQEEILEVDHVAQSVSEIDISNDVKIIGLGEASHGNVEFQELKLTVLKKLVEKENVRSFALETDFSGGLIVNKYVHGGDGNAKDMVKYLSFDIYQTKQMQDLIDWMREYNLGKMPSEQLSFYGFDMQNPEKGVDLVLDYCKNQNLLNEENLQVVLNPIKNLSRGLSIEDSKVAFETLKKIQSRINVAPKTAEAQLVSQVISNMFHALEYYQNPGNDYIAVNNARDAYMTENVSWIKAFEEERGNGRILIAGHNGHIAYQDRFFTTMGSRLHQQYSKGYYVIGSDYFYTTVNINSNSGRSNQSFNSADPLAAQAKRFGGSYYLDFKKIKEGGEIFNLISKPVSMGSLGETYSFLMHFYPPSHRIQGRPQDYYDAMIFVYQATPIQPFVK